MFRSVLVNASESESPYTYSACMKYIQSADALPCPKITTQRTVYSIMIAHYHTCLSMFNGYFPIRNLRVLTFFFRVTS